MCTHYLYLKPVVMGNQKLTVEKIDSDNLNIISLIVRVFRNNMKAILETAKNTSRFIKLKTPTGSFYIIPAEEIEQVTYNVEMIEKIKKGEKDFAKGNSKKIDLDNLWK